MSAFVDKVNTWYENLPLRQRYLIMAGIGTMLIAGIAFFASTETQLINSVVPSVAKPKPAEIQPVMPKGYTAQTMRDPFAPPPGLGKSDKPLVSPAAGNYAISPAMPPQGRVAPQDSSKESLPLLVGVVSGGNRQMAIISYNNTSRSYYPGQEIGVYKLVKVDTNSVVVQGPSGRRVLALGR